MSSPLAPRPAPRRLGPSIGLLGVLLLAGCWINPHTGGDNGNGGDNGGNGGQDSDTSTTVVPGELENFGAHVSERVPTVLIVEWTTTKPGVSHVEYGFAAGDLAESDLDRATPSTDTSATTHRVVVLGLKAGRDYAFKAVTVTDDGERLESGVSSVAIDIQHPDLPILAIDEQELDAAMGGADGYVLFSIMQMANSWVAIVDRDGDYVWYAQADDGLNIPSSHTSPDGDAIVYTQNDRLQKSDVGGIVRLTMDGEEKLITFTPAGHHDAIELPGEDSIAFINLEVQDLVVDGRPAAPITFDNIYISPTGDRDGSAAEKLWSFNPDDTEALGTYPHDPWRMCEHFDDFAYSSGGRDYTHSNSIMSNEDASSLYIMSKNLDALIKVDRATGATVWQLGGRDSNFTFEGESGAFADSPDTFSHPHMSHLWSDGLCVFDNGYHHDTDNVGTKEPFSRAIEYRYDESTMKVEKVWEWWLDPAYFNPELGDCRRLANGNHLVSVTVAGYAVELDTENNVVWRMRVDEVGASVGRVTYLSDLYTLAEQ